VLVVIAINILQLLVLLLNLFLKLLNLPFKLNLDPLQLMLHGLNNFLQPQNLLMLLPHHPVQFLVLPLHVLDSIFERLKGADDC
jgi:hypothetical protein